MVKRAYVSGAYRAPTEDGIWQNIARARALAVKLWQMGYAVLCPHTSTAFMGGVVPDDAFLRGDLSWVGQSDIVVMLRGWPTSAGAVIEHDFALAQGVPVYEEDAVPPPDQAELWVPEALIVRPDYESVGWGIAPETHWMPRVDTVVVHHEGGKEPEGTSALAIHRWQLTPKAEGGPGFGAIGYHYLFERDGVIAEGRPLWAQAAHCKPVNSHSWALCVIGNLNLVPPTDEQRRSLVSVLRSLATRAKVTVKGDRELRATDCPGKFLDLDWLRSKP